MAVHSPPTSPATGSTGGNPHRVRPPVTGWVLGILGAIATFMGAFILLAGDEQSIGLGGQASWKVGEIDPAWGVGLLTGGVLVLLFTLVRALRAPDVPTPPVTQPRSSWRDVAAHAGVFLVVTEFLWVQDIALGDGLNYAYWVTIPWGIGLTVHALTSTRPPTAARKPAGSDARDR